MDIKDLEVRAIVSASSVNCSKLHPEKFYTLKNPGINHTGLGNIIDMEADVYNDNKNFLGRISLDNFVFGLKTSSVFSIMEDGKWVGGSQCVFIVKDSSFPNMIFQYVGSIAPSEMEYNGQKYILSKMYAYRCKDNSEIVLEEANCDTTFGFFGDPSNGPLYLLDIE